MRVHEGTIAQLRKHLRVAESEAHDLQIMKQRREEDLAEAHEQIAALKS
jgi:hypothetical protein